VKTAILLCALLVLAGCARTVPRSDHPALDRFLFTVLCGGSTAWPECREWRPRP
jgi:hypothetical protein